MAEQEKSLIVLKQADREICRARVWMVLREGDLIGTTDAAWRVIRIETMRGERVVYVARF